MSDNKSVGSIPQILVCNMTSTSAEPQLVTRELNHELNKGEVNNDAFTQCQDIQYVPLDKFVDQCNAIVFSPIKEEDLYSDYSDESSYESGEETSEETSYESSDVDW